MLKKFASRHGMCRVKRETCERGATRTEWISTSFRPPRSSSLPGSAILRGRVLLSQTCGPWDFRRAGIALPQSLATVGWARLAVPPCPLTLPPGPCYSRARSGQFYSSGRLRYESRLFRQAHFAHSISGALCPCQTQNQDIVPGEKVRGYSS